MGQWRQGGSYIYTNSRGGGGGWGTESHNYKFICLTSCIAAVLEEGAHSISIV